MKRAAFTLVELSIVLVILGLLVGGVLSGQSLIRAAELRAIPNEAAKFQAALHSFRDKYFAIPGDMTNATNFWPATTDGDGDGLVSTPEGHTAWQQLGLSGLVEGAYTGTSSSDPNDTAQPGVNVPTSKIDSSAGWLLYGYGPFEPGDQLYISKPGNALYVGGMMNAGNTNGEYELFTGIISPAEAFNIDTKMDDGRPNRGTVVPYPHTVHHNCSDATDIAYDLANETRGCTLFFLLTARSQMTDHVVN